MDRPARREELRRVQTPQGFRFVEILAAHRAWDGPPLAGDDAQVARAQDMDVALVEGDEALHKLTFASDFEASTPLVRSEEHTSELQSLMRISYAVFCLKKK